MKASFINFKGQGSKALVGPKRQCYNGMWLHAIRLLYLQPACEGMWFPVRWSTDWYGKLPEESCHCWKYIHRESLHSFPKLGWNQQCHLAPLFLLSLKHSFITQRLKSYCTAVCDNCCFLQGSTRLSGNASNTQTGLNADDSPSLV